MTVKKLSPIQLKAKFGRGDHVPKEVIAAAQNFLRCRQQRNKAERELQTASKSLRIAEEELLRLMDEAGLCQIPFEGARLSTFLIAHYRLEKGDLDDGAVMRWLLRNGGHDLVERRVNESSFSAFCRRLADAGKPILSKVRHVLRRYVRVEKR